MTSTDRALFTTYLVLAAAALVGTQVVLVQHFVDGGTMTSALTDSVASPAATFVTIDLLVVAFAAVILMIVEGRRLGMTRLWAYVLVTFAIAVSVAFPVFLAIRQRHLARTRTP